MRPISSRRASPAINRREMLFVILVDENDHHMDSIYSFRGGKFATAEKAFAPFR